MDADGYAVRTLSGRTDAQRANSRARHICRADRERKDHPVVRLLRPADRPGYWLSRLVHRVDRALMVLERLRSFQASPGPWGPADQPSGAEVFRRGHHQNWLWLRT